VEKEQGFANNDTGGMLQSFDEILEGFITSPWILEVRMQPNFATVPNNHKSQRTWEQLFCTVIVQGFAKEQ